MVKIYTFFLTDFSRLQLILKHFVCRHLMLQSFQSKQVIFAGCFFRHHFLVKMFLSPFHVMMFLVTMILTISWISIHTETMPQWLNSLFLFGKTSEPVNVPCGPVLSLIYRIASLKLPKSFFKLFYTFALLTILMSVFMPDIVTPVHMIFFSKCDSELQFNTVYALVYLLVVVHATRRRYECSYISIYSPKSTINLLQFVMGFWFYSTLMMTVTSLALLKTGQSAPRIRPAAALPGTIIFIVGSVIQYKSHKTLADLRKTPGGKEVVKYDHSMPSGHLFDYVSNPHYFAEVLIYAALFLVTDFDLNFSIILYYVLISHMIMGLISHRWYLKTFGQKYPFRYILIPYVY